MFIKFLLSKDFFNFHAISADGRYTDIHHASAKELQYHGSNVYQIGVKRSFTEENIVAPIRKPIRLRHGGLKAIPNPPPTSPADVISREKWTDIQSLLWGTI